MQNYYARSFNKNELENSFFKTREIERLEKFIKLNNEALKIFDYVVSKFRSNPSIVDLFDSKIVNKAIELQKKRESL